ncbi:MAG TPA: LysM domain-containing protein [Verrucomicrobiae bacterium]|nr:LysM domain-containing protein [Verrucomicrobiae bacterium]
MTRHQLLMLSLTANIVLAVGWMFFARHEQAQLQHHVVAEPAPLHYKTNVLVRHQFFSWGDLESSDYPTYVANLRAIGCPEQTVRDVIIADVNAHYARRLALEVTTPDQQWWRTEADTNVQAIAEAKTAALDDERRALLAQLLGPNWEGGDLISLPRPTQAMLDLDGPVLGAMPAEVKESVEQITLRWQQRIQEYVDAQRLVGKDPDPAMMTKLEQQMRAELAGVLSPQQMEEFALRYSSTAENLRNELGDLKYFNATPDEFRKIFDAVEGINAKLATVSDTDPNAAQIRASLEEQRLAAIKAALGDKRYGQYLVLHDPAYQDAVQAAQAANAPQSAGTIYEINRAAAEEQNRIQSSTNLTPEQMGVELKKVELQQAQANLTAAGQPPVEDQPPPPPTAIYTLSLGENLNGISQRFGVPVSTIQALNPGIDLTHVRPGDMIRLPAQTH